MITIPSNIVETLEAAPDSLPINCPRQQGPSLTAWLVTRHNIPFHQARNYAALWDYHRKTRKIPDEVIKRSFEMKTNFESVLSLSRVEAEEFEDLLSRNICIS